MQVGSLSANRNLIIVLVILLELGAGVYYFFSVYQTMEQTKRQKEQTVETKKKEVREIELTKRLLAEERDIIGQLKADIARIEKFFPEEVFIPRVLVLIENLAMATHVEIDSIRPTRARKRRASAARSGTARPAAASGKEKPLFNPDKEFTTTDIDFKITGSFQNVYNFMDELATFPKLVVVDNLQITPQGDQEESETQSVVGKDRKKDIEIGGYMELDVQLPLTFYVQKQGAPEIDLETGDKGTKTK